MGAESDTTPVSRDGVLLLSGYVGMEVGNLLKNFGHLIK